MKNYPKSLQEQLAPHADEIVRQGLEARARAAMKKAAKPAKRFVDLLDETLPEVPRSGRAESGTSDVPSREDFAALLAEQEAENISRQPVKESLKIPNPESTRIGGSMPRSLKRT